MLKKAQKTKFDEKIQTKLNYPSPVSEQFLLFDTENKPYNSEQYSHPREYIYEKYKPLDLEYPELKEEHIKTSPLDSNQEQRVRNEINYKLENPNIGSNDPEIKELSKYLEDNKIIDAFKGQILFKYEELRKKTAEFYLLYKEANSLAESEYHIDTNVSYAELFKNYGNLLNNELSKQIGYLFGIFTDTNYINKFKTFNIFNINAFNYTTKISNMNSMINAMDAISKDYLHRKKLIKQLSKKIQQEVEDFLNNPEFKAFTEWMDVYFPYDKEVLVNKSIRKIKSTFKSNQLTNITFGDLIQFKTFKSIYEKAQLASTLGFKNNIISDISQQIENELYKQLIKKIEKPTNELLNVLESYQNSKEPSLFFSEFIQACKKSCNIDLRALFTFALNVLSNKTNTKDPNLNLTIDQDKKDKKINDWIRQISFRLNRLKEEINKDIMYAHSFSNFSSLVNSYISKKILNNININTTEGMEKLLLLSDKDIQNFANHLIYINILESISIFDSSFGPDIKMSGIKDILYSNNGKFSIEAIASYAHNYLPFVSINLLQSVIKIAFKELNYELLNALSNAPGSNFQNAVKFLIRFLEKNKKLEANSFYKLLNNIYIYSNTISDVSSLLSIKDNEKIIEIMLKACRNLNTLNDDMANLKSFISFIHNEAGNISAENLLNIISNNNFINFKKSNILKKIIQIYTKIKSLGGIKGIEQKYNDTIPILIKENFIDSNIYKNIEVIQKLFDSNSIIKPTSPNFEQINETSSKLESDLTMLQMYRSLKDLLVNYTNKDENLFKLNLEITPNIRFRVLKDKDPRILRIGIETNCCQRIGGVGEIAARDSFINPLAGVLISEWRENEASEWKLLGQSYFHFVPKDNGYILDNVEDNSKNVEEFTENTNITLDELYAIFAAQVKSKLNITYLLAGSGFSKINVKKFKKDKRYEDPRTFDNRALTEKNKTHYTDYNNKNSLDLLAPTFNINKIQNKLSQVSIKMNKFVKSILHPFALLKNAQLFQQDIKTLTGINTQIFGPQSWIFVNQFMNELNKDLNLFAGNSKIGGQDINFQTVVKNPTIITRFTGTMKSLCALSMKLWHFVIDPEQKTTYTVEESLDIINQLMNEITIANFPEPKAQHIKPTLINILNNWKAILK